MGRKKQKIESSSQARLLQCPVCLSDKLDMISVRMKKCESCGFIWNHEVSDRDNLLLILEHQAKRAERDAGLATIAPKIQISPSKAPRKAQSR